METKDRNLGTAYQAGNKSFEAQLTAVQNSLKNLDIRNEVMECSIKLNPAEPSCTPPGSREIIMHTYSRNNDDVDAIAHPPTQEYSDMYAQHNAKGSSMEQEVDQRNSLEELVEARLWERGVKEDPRFVFEAVTGILEKVRGEMTEEKYQELYRMATALLYIQE